MTTFTSLALLAALVGCNSGGRQTGTVEGTHGKFIVLRTNPPNNGTLYLNEPIAIDFSSSVDLSTADLNSVSFAVFDLNGTPLPEQPAGMFRLGVAAGETDVGRRLEFHPRFPTNDTYDDGGFKPARRYVVQLVGGERRNGTVLRDTRGQTLAAPSTFEFSTVDGSSAAQLFRNTRPGGPRKVGFEATPVPTASGYGLNKLGLDPLELRLKFDQPLNPAGINVPVRIDLNPARRDPTRRGRIFLEYDDPAPGGRGTWIPASVDLEVNTLDGSEVVLRPLGVLPNNATVRVMVLNTLEDMSGESNIADVSYNPVFHEFQTRSTYAPQFDALVENFDDAGQIDLEAPFLEPLAQLRQGRLQASFQFESSKTFLEYEPRSAEVILNTDFTQITPKNAPPINVAGGVFAFDRVVIPRGVTVRGTGTRPMVWLVTGDFIVDGEISVRGGDGERVNTLNSANFPTGGGIGSCGGGNGGKGSPNITGTSQFGEDGYGPGQVPGQGGKGGQISCRKCSTKGSGGGGGSFTTKGDPRYRWKAGANNLFKQVEGFGGYGCNRTLEGGAPGPLVFTDSRTDNDLWGSGVDVARQIRITGELVAPLGGQGGGGGGDESSICTSNQNWITDRKGGGGGGGGGVLIIKVLGKFRISETGIVRADGGHGGGGEAAGGSTNGGGGGGGSGGMIVVMAGGKIELVVKGTNGALNNSATYSENLPGSGSYNFCMSADGGVGLRGSYGGTIIDGKYPPGQPSTESAWDATPVGGFGGLGLIQLMAPPGDPATNVDGTNTVLDDNIDLYLDPTQAPLTGANKMKYLSWQGFNGKDDAGQDIPATILGREGDIRPFPVLLPSTISPTSRMRSQWIDTGATVRRPLDPRQYGVETGDGQPRGIVEQGDRMGNPFANLVAGPTFLFGGTQTTGNAEGYLRYTPRSGSVELDQPLVLAKPAGVLGVDANSSYEGRPAYRVELTAVEPKLVEVGPGRYAHFRAQLLDAAEAVLGEFRILDHTDRVLWLSPDAGAMPAGVSKLQVRQKFFDVVTDRAPGLGPTFQENNATLPVANVRIGFAFHTNPADPSGKRYPADPRDFLFGLDLQDPDTMKEVRDFMRGNGPNDALHFVQWDVLFNGRYSETPGNRSGTALESGVPLPELHYLVLPFQF